jgi:hypothetical protein
MCAQQQVSPIQAFEEPLTPGTLLGTFQATTWSVQPGIARRLNSTRAHHRAQLDAIFVLTLLAFRRAMLAALQSEPESSVRHLRAYIRCLLDNVLQRPRGQLAAATLLMHNRYRSIWDDFVNEACAHDECSTWIANHCKDAAQNLWINHALQSDIDPHGVSKMGEHLLALSRCGSHRLSIDNASIA